MITDENTESLVVDQIIYWQDYRRTPDVRLFTAAGMSRPTWKKRIEDREGSFTIRELIAICDVLGIKLSDLFNKAEETTKERVA